MYYTWNTFLFDCKLFFSRSSETSATMRPTAPRHCTTDLLLMWWGRGQHSSLLSMLKRYAQLTGIATTGGHGQRNCHRCCYVTDATRTAPAPLMQQPTMGQLTLSLLMSVTHHLFAFTDHCWHLNPTTTKINKQCWRFERFIYIFWSMQERISFNNELNSFAKFVFIYVRSR